MRKKLHHLNAVLIFTAFFLFGCQDTITTTIMTTSSTSPTQTSSITTVPTSSILTTTEPLLNATRSDSEVYSVYLLALEAGAYSGSYEDWLESIEGPQGDPGKQVLLRALNNKLEWQYEDDDSWNVLFDLGLLRGTDGVGIDLVEIDDSGNLIVTYTDERTDNLGRIVTVYSVEFKDDSGYLYSSQIVGVGGSATPPTGISKNGHDFVNWEGIYENVTQNTVVTAQFTKREYSITFDSSGGSLCETITEISFGESAILPEPIKEGYRFLGWYQGDSINSAPFFDSNQVTKDFELVARWELLTHIVCFIDEDGALLLSLNVPHGVGAYLPENPVKQGYTFSEWDHDPSIITDDVIMKPMFTPNNYTISFNSNGGSAIASVTLPYLTELPSFSEPTRTGYAFIGWFSDSAFSEPFSLTTMPLGGMTLYAKWQIQSYTLTFDTQGGTEIPEQTLIYNTSLIVPTEPFKEFYDFVGWSSVPDAYVPYLFTSMPAEDLTIYAIWEEAALLFALLEDETYGIIGVNPVATEIIVPTLYKGIAVTKIMTGAFQNGSQVKSLVVNGTVLTMEAGCLAGLSVLENLSVPFVGINRDATSFDATLGILFGSEAYVGSIEISHYLSIRNIQKYQIPASLRTLTITDASILRLGSLSGLTMITEINVADTVQSIETGAFAATLSLKSLTLPFVGKSATSSGNDAVLGEIFGSIQYSATTPSYYQGSTRYYLPNGLESLKITGGTCINSFALMNLRSLREVSLADSITDFGEQAFYNDIALASIVLPNQLRIIGNYAFAYDPSVLPSLKPALNAIVFPSSLEEVGTRIFGHQEYNTSLKIYAMVSSSNIHSCWGDLDDLYEVIYDGETRGVHNGLDYVNIKGEGVTIIGVHFGNKDSVIVIPSYLDPDINKTYVTRIAPGAFANAPYLEELWIKDNIYYAGTNSVSGSNLTVYLELPYIPEWWTTASWNPSGVPVVLDATFPD